MKNSYNFEYINIILFILKMNINTQKENLTMMSYKDSKLNKDIK